MLHSPTNCPFCRQNNLLKGEVIASTDGAYLIRNNSSPGNFLIIPSRHTESPLDLADNWWQDVKAMLAKVPGLTGDYNIALNYGKAAGQSVKHLHFWIIPRDGAAPAAGIGLARFIDGANQE